MIHIEIKHEDVLEHINVNTFDTAYAMACSDTFEPVSVADITPVVPASAYAFVNDFESANMRNARANQYGLAL